MRLFTTDLGELKASALSIDNMGLWTAGNNKKYIAFRADGAEEGEDNTNFAYDTIPNNTLLLIKD